MRSFRERDPLPIGIIGLIVIAAVAALAFFSSDLPVVGGGSTYHADFTEAAGLESGNEVRIAGVKVGSVTSVALAGDHVSVGFRVGDAWLGDQSVAAIKIKTLLGQKYLALDPQGARSLDPHTAIPRAHTLSPYDVLDAFNGLTSTVSQLDTTGLATAFQTMADTLGQSAPEITGALSGLQRLSTTISSRDAQLGTLLGNTKTVSTVLADRDAEVSKLLTDGNTLLAEISARRTAISDLLAGTRALSTQLQGLVADDTAILRPALDQLDGVATVLQRNQDQLGRGIAMLAPFTRVFANVVGSGRWFDAYFCNLLLPATDISTGGCVPNGPPQPRG
jgi:phospholipid/cholesterol/gamma-HCH transport system substrate-binding protein